jgi:hypothetical protein
MVTPEMAAPIDATAPKPLPVMPRQFMVSSTLDQKKGKTVGAADANDKGGRTAKGH